MPYTPDLRTVGLLVTVIAIAVTAWRVGAVRVAAAERGHESATPDRYLSALTRGAMALVAATWVLLVFGSSVRVNGAGLACPDWPACFGEIVPALDWKVSLEFGHRVYAGVIGLVFVGLGAAVLRRKELRPVFLPLFALAAVALAVQIVLGGLTVLHLLDEWTVASHLLVGNTFTMLLGLIALSLHDRARPITRRPVGALHRAAAVVLAVLVFAQIGLGGFVASSHAGLACGTWPGCNGPQWFPTFEGIIGLQVTHRLTAYLILGAAAFAFGATRGHGRSGRVAALVLGLVVVQASLGVANVLLRLPVEITLLHSAGAAATVLATAWLNHEVWRAPLAVAASRQTAAGTLGAAEVR